METNNQQQVKGMNLNTYVGLMNILFLVPSFGWIISLVMWLIGKEESEYVNIRGKDMANWFISVIIYSFAIMMGCVLFLVLSPLVGGILMISAAVVIGLFTVVCPIIGGIKAFNGEAWNYPLALKLIK